MGRKKNPGITRREFIARTSKAVAAASLAAGSPGLVTGCATIGIDVGPGEVIIRNGTVYDGTRAEPEVKDIRIRGDRIVEIGRFPEGNTGTVIDAKGLAVTPGFIDIHTHSDIPIQKLGMKRFAAYFMPSWKGNYSYLHQGVTTIVTGNCGYGYTDTAKWLDIVDSMGFGSNVYHLAPHGEIRMELFGADQPYPLSQKQLEAMKHRLEEEMDKGAIGFSSGLEYAPGLSTPAEELVALNAVVKKYDRIYTTHLRDLTGKTYPGERPGVEVTLEEAIETARRAGVRLQLSHFMIKAPMNNARVDTVLDMIAKARQDGVKVLADQFPYPAGQTLLSSRLPNEFKDFQGVKKEFRTKEGMARVREAIERRFAITGPERFLIAACPEHPAYEGMTIKEIAEAEGVPPSKVYADLVSEERSPMAIFFDQDVNNVNRIMAEEDVITASDAFTMPHGMFRMHPAAYGTFPRRFRQCAVEGKQMSPSAVIRTMTSLPAEAFNLKQRGKIAEGYFADIAVIDLQKFSDKATFVYPHLYAEGVVHLFVNGVQAIENGKATGRRGGHGVKAM